MHAEAVQDEEAVRDFAVQGKAGRDKADRGPRGTVVYLAPGLSAAQRAAALRRLRQEGSRNCGPRLSARELAVALAADRIRIGCQHTTAAVRLHPVTMLASAMLAGGLLAAFALAAVSVRVAPVADPAAQAAALPAAAARATAIASTSALDTKGRPRGVSQPPAARKPAPFCVTPVGGCPHP